jgi:hypothetical protein
MNKTLPELFADCITPAEANEMRNHLIRTVNRHAEERIARLRNAYSMMPHNAGTPRTVEISVHCPKCIEETLRHERNARKAGRKPRRTIVR